MLKQRGKTLKRVYLESGDLQELIQNYFQQKVAAEINDFEVEKYIDKKEARRMDRFTQSCSSSSENGSCRCKA